jgi:lipopolysaccharide transport system permease protein
MNDAIAEKSPQLAALPSQIVIEPTRGWFSFRFGELWAYRELLLFLVWRDLKVRYKQTALGAAWIIFQPVISIVIFSFLFGTVLEVPSGDIPYPVFAFAALLPWNYFASSLTKSSTSLVINANLITKVYFPRLLIPITGVLSGLVDFAISFILLVVLMVYYQVGIYPSILFLPAFLLLAILTALGFSLWLSAMNVRYRDVNYLIPFLVQIWMYLTPVLYSSMMLPPGFRFLISLNPMTGVVEGFRWALFGSQMAEIQPPGIMLVISAIITLVVLVTGVIYFRVTERTFADII